MGVCDLKLNAMPSRASTDLSENEAANASNELSEEGSPLGLCPNCETNFSVQIAARGPEPSQEQKPAGRVQDATEGPDEEKDEGADADAMECPKQRILRPSQVPSRTAAPSSCTRRLLVPRCPWTGTALHGGVARGVMNSDNRCLKLASVFAELEACDKILDLNDLSYSISTHQNPPRCADTDVLGSGSMGILYSAMLRCDGGMHRAVAVKHRLSSMTYDDAEAETLRSMLIGAKMQAHPNVIEFVGAMMHKTHGLLAVFERIDGFNMNEYYQMQQIGCKNWRPKLHTALDWSQQMFAALDWIHSGNEPIIHRDVKPSNLMLCGEGFNCVKLIDFGLARLIPEQHLFDAAVSRTAAASWASAAVAEVGETRGCKMERDVGRDQSLEGGDLTSQTGTYLYMAPEVFLLQSDKQDEHRDRQGCSHDERGGLAPVVRGGNEGYGTKADIYSATMTLHFMVSGQVAFGRIPPKIIAERAARNGSRPPLDLIKKKHGEFAGDLIGLMEAGWASAPEDRPTAGQVRAELLCLGARVAEAAGKKTLKNTLKELKGQIRGVFQALKRNFAAPLGGGSSSPRLPITRSSSASAEALPPWMPLGRCPSEPVGKILLPHSFTF